MLTRETFKKILEVNHFPEVKEPTILCLRNTGKNHEFIEDTGNNNTCIYYLIDPDSISGPLTGRSFANSKYQSKMVAGTAKANKIASGFYESAWTHGLHFGCRAMKQNKSFLIIRSYDGVFGNDDDVNEVGIVADNFHGWAPGSAGCCTVSGNMKKVDPTLKTIPDQIPSGDWFIVDAWAYERHKNQRYFTAIVLEHFDLDLKPRLRFGSIGDDVKKLQKLIGIKEDGDFGQTTHSYVKMYERKNGINPAEGIWEI